MYRMILITAIAMATPLASAESTVPESTVPKECRFMQGEVAGASATMACYAALDRNGDGALSPDEADALPRLRGRINALDLDDNGQLSPDEFQAEMTTPAQRGGAKGV